MADGQILVGGPGHGMPVPTLPLGVLHVPDREYGDTAFYVSRRYWSLWPIPGWEMEQREDVTKRTCWGGIEPVWTVRAWAQEFHHSEISAFIDSRWGYEIDAVLAGYLWRDDEVIDAVLPRALAAAQTLAEMTGTVPTERRVSYGLAGVSR